MTSRLIFPTVLLLVAVLSISSFADDWAQWRGPKRDAKSEETGLLTEWPEGGPPLAWRVDGIGGGYSTVSIVDGTIYTMGDFDDQSHLIALKESDGSELWRTAIGKAGGHKDYPGSRSTPTVDGGQVFALTEHGVLACVDAKSGEKQWSVDLVGDFGGRAPRPWKYSESPLVDGNQVICTPGGNDGTLLALDRNSGKKLWRTKEWTDNAAYSSVIISTIEGKRQYIQLTDQSVAGVDPESGKVLWRVNRKGATAVIPTPVVFENLVFVTSGYGIGCNGFRVTRDGSEWSAEEVYANQNITNHHGGVVLVDGHVYGSTGPTFRCVDIESGELAEPYPQRSIGKGSTLYADGHFYLRSENGPVALIKAAPGEYLEVSRFDQPARSNKSAWPHPVIANGKLYLRDQGLLLCYDIKKR